MKQITEHLRFETPDRRDHLNVERYDRRRMRVRVKIIRG